MHHPVNPSAKFNSLNNPLALVILGALTLGVSSAILREIDVGPLDFTLEQGREAVYRAGGLHHEVKQLDQIALVALYDLAEAHVQSFKWRLVGGQHQQIIR